MRFIRLKFDTMPRIMFAHNSVLVKKHRNEYCNPYHEITFIESGTVAYSSDASSDIMQVNAGEFMFSPANTRYVLQNNAERIMHSCVAFFLDAEQKYCDEQELEFEMFDNRIITKNESIYIPLAGKFIDNDHAYRTMKLIIDEQKRKQRYSNLICSSYIVDLLVSMALRAAEYRDNRTQKSVAPINEYYCNKIDNYIKKYYANAIDLRGIAEFMGLHPNYISNLYKKTRGQTIINMLTKIRIEEAKKLMYIDKFTIKDIARMVGYEDCNYFSEVFRKNEGLSPSAFIKSIVKTPQ